MRWAELMKWMTTKGATHAGLLGADFQAKVDALVDGYLTAREAQMEQKGGVTDTRGNRDESKLLLQNRLFDNLLFFAAAQKDPDKCTLYFNQALLEDLASGADSAPLPPLS